MDITIEGFISDLRVSDGDTAIVYFNLKNEEGVLQNLPCYAVINNKDSLDYIQKIDTKKMYCVDGCICSDGIKTDFQAHCFYQKPEKIYA